MDWRFVAVHGRCTSPNTLGSARGVTLLGDAKAGSPRSAGAGYGRVVGDDHDDSSRRRVEFWPRGHRLLDEVETGMEWIVLGAAAVVLVILWLTGLIEPFSI